MKLKKKKPKIYAATMSLAVAAGVAAGVSNYRSGTQFEPTGSSQEIRENRVSFSDESSKTNQRKDDQKDNSALWEKDENAQDQSAMDEAQNAAYLFEQAQNQLGNGQTTINVAQPNDQQMPDAAASKKKSKPNENEPVYDITDKKDDADTVIKNPGSNSDNKENAQSGNGNGKDTPKSDTENTPGKKDDNTSGNGDNSADDNGGHTGDGDKDQNNSSGSDNTDHTGNNGKDDKNDKDDSNNGSDKPKPPSNASTAKDPEVTEKPAIAPSVSDRVTSYVEDQVTKDYVEKMIHIGEGLNTDWMLYKGQRISAWTVYCALDTYVLDTTTDGNNIAYVWGNEDYGRYIQVTGVSFDQEKTWTNLPATIPEYLEDDQMYIRVQYRLSVKDDWTEISVPYTVKATRLFILSEQLKTENEEIDLNKVLNDSDQYPEMGSTLKLLKYVLNYFNWSGEPLPGLLPGWMEDGELIPWRYQITAGRHILEPAELVPLDPTYVVQLKFQWFTEDGKVDPDGNEYYFLQTLTDLNLDTVSENGAKYLKELKVPKYVQAVVINENSIETEKLYIPDTVLYVENDGISLRVNKAYEVDEKNSEYSSEDGLLMSKNKEEILGIPYERTTLEVQKNVTKVNIPSDNQIQTIYLKAENIDQVPEIQQENLHGCKVVVADEILDQFLEMYGEDLTENENCIAANSDSDKTYSVHNNVVIDNKGELYRIFNYDEISLKIPENITSIGVGAFQTAEKLHTLLWPETRIDLNSHSFDGSAVQKIICRSQKQMEELTGRLNELNITGIQVFFSEKTEDGYAYFSESSESGSVIITLTEAPSDVTEFDGKIQTENGMLIVNEIAANAFSDCKSLKWVTLPEETYSIGYQAFRGCSTLEGVLINTKESVSIGNQAFDGCESLRFIASNAETGIMSSGYDPAVNNQRNFDDAKPIEFFFVLPDAKGYGSHANMLFGENGMDHYEVRKTGAEGRVLYAVDADGKAWMALRSGSRMDGQVTLPKDTSQIYDYAFSESSGLEAGYQVNWSELQMDQIRKGAFFESDLSGEVEIEGKGSLILEDYSFSFCEKMQAVSIKENLNEIGQMVFTGDSGLASAEFNDISDSASFYAGIFNSCFQLKTITLNTETPLHLVVYGTMKFQFNNDWSAEDEKQNLRLNVPDGTQDDYIMNWRYTFAGSLGIYTGNYYLDLWNDVQSELIDWTDFSFPADEEVDVATKERLLEGENRIRTMLGKAELSEPTDLYQFRLVGNNLTLVGIPSYSRDISLDAKTVDLPEGWYLDAIGAGAFSGAENLSSVDIPNNMSEIESGALSGAASVSSNVTLNIVNCGTEDARITALTGFSESDPFTFGIEESKLHVNVPEGEEEDYIRSWTYPLVGYENAEQLEVAVRKKLEESDDGAEGEADQNSAEDDPDQVEAEMQKKIEQEMIKLLLPAENRLRRMMGLKEAKDAEELYCYDFTGRDAAETKEAESEEMTEEQSEQETFGQESESESEASSDAEKDTEETESQTEPETETEKQSEPETGAETEAEKQTEKATESQNTEASGDEEQKTDAASQDMDAEIRQETEFEVIL